MIHFSQLVHLAVRRANCREAGVEMGTGQEACEQIHAADGGGLDGSSGFRE